MVEVRVERFGETSAAHAILGFALFILEASTAVGHLCQILAEVVCVNTEIFMATSGLTARLCRVLRALRVVSVQRLAQIS